MKPGAVGASEPPIACELKALTPSDRHRQATLLRTVRAKIKKTSELKEGFELTFPADRETVMALAEWINLESRCCRFAAFSMEWDDEDGVRVRLSGPPGARDVLAAEMGLRTTAPRA